LKVQEKKENFESLEGRWQGRKGDITGEENRYIAQHVSLLVRLQAVPEMVATPQKEQPFRAESQMWPWVYTLF